jgi:large subunit ribosomal protein L23
MQVLQKAVITEKANQMNEAGTYAFIVNGNANKIQIKDAVEKAYDVKVESVRVVNSLGKMKSKYTKTGLVSGRKPSHKKAYVTVAEDNFIDIYENV